MAKKWNDEIGNKKTLAQQTTNETFVQRKQKLKEELFIRIAFPLSFRFIVDIVVNDVCRNAICRFLFRSTLCFAFTLSRGFCSSSFSSFRWTRISFRSFFFHSIVAFRFCFFFSLDLHVDSLASCEIGKL